jgi:hypothetical protein
LNFPLFFIEIKISIAHIQGSIGKKKKKKKEEEQSYEID